MNSKEKHIINKTINYEQWMKKLKKDFHKNTYVYFVHSYYAAPDDSAVIAATTEYPKPFASALARNNVFAVQFHPEKSQAVGLQLLHNFLHWDGQV